MIVIDGLSAQNYQNFQVPLPDGTNAFFRLIFRPRVSYWFLDVAWKTKIIKGIKVCSVPNLLEQFSNILPFGVNIQVDDGSEPILINDFFTGRVKFNVLNQQEMDMIDSAYMVGTP